MKLIIAIVFFSFFLAGFVDAQNPHFTFRIDGPCGETVVGPPGSLWDDGTGGDPFFEGSPPGQTWDVILTTADNDRVYGVGLWRVALGVEGPLVVTSVTVNGTAGCIVGQYPECRRHRHFSSELTEITGPPAGAGPQTEKNVGAVSEVLLDSTFDGKLTLAREGSEKVLKLRVLADFPETDGEVVTVRLVFETRIGTSGAISPLVGLPVGRPITIDEGDPPLMVVPCEIFLKATSVAAFIRCDANDDGRLNLTDAIWIFTDLFRGGAVTRCPVAADCNKDGKRNLADGIYGLRYLFTDSPPPPFPFPKCGRVDLPVEECPPGSTKCS